MASTEDLFTPIHKAIRSMIYDLGGRLQRADFADKASSTVLLADFQHEFANAVSPACVLCLLHAHAGAEESEVFPTMRAIDPALIQSLIEEHHEITGRLIAITKMADELRSVDALDRRLALGAQVNRTVNEFFAYYLTHMNKEETTIVPAMKEHFTDDQMRALQGAIIGAMPPERFAAYLRWMLPSLSLAELTGTMAGVKHGGRPEVLKAVAGIGEANVDPARWALVRERVGF
jgi:hypothetical protein